MIEELISVMNNIDNTWIILRVDLLESCANLDWRQCFLELFEPMSIDPAELQKMLDERDKSRASRRRAWENLQEMRWVLKQVRDIELPPPARKAIDLEGRVVKDGIKKALKERQDALSELVDAIRLYGKLADKTPLTLREADDAQAVQRLNAAIDRADGLVSQ
jgi:hypothetical protein